MAAIDKSATQAGGRIIDPSAASIGGAAGNPCGYLIRAKVIGEDGRTGYVTLVFDPTARDILKKECPEPSLAANTLGETFINATVTHWDSVTKG